VVSNIQKRESGFEVGGEMKRRDKWWWGMEMNRRS